MSVDDQMASQLDRALRLSGRAEALGDVARLLQHGDVMLAHLVDEALNSREPAEKKLHMFASGVAGIRADALRRVSDLRDEIQAEVDLLRAQALVLSRTGDRRPAG